MPTSTKTGITLARFKELFPHATDATIRSNAALFGWPQSSPSPVAEASPKRKDGAQHHKGNAVRSLIACGLPAPECEHRFHPVRRWRMDYAWPAQKVALEVEGGIWTEGRHTRGNGFLGDIEKYNEAVARGWRIVRCVPDNLLAASTIEILKRLIQ